MLLEQVQERASNGQGSERQGRRQAGEVKREVPRQAVFANDREHIAVDLEGFLVDSRGEGRVETLRKALCDEGLGGDRGDTGLARLQGLHVHR